MCAFVRARGCSFVCVFVCVCERDEGGREGGRELEGIKIVFSNWQVCRRALEGLAYLHSLRKVPA